MGVMVIVVAPSREPLAQHHGDAGDESDVKRIRVELVLKMMVEDAIVHDHAEDDQCVCCGIEGVAKCAQAEQSGCQASIALTPLLLRTMHPFVC